MAVEKDDRTQMPTETVVAASRWTSREIITQIHSFPLDAEEVQGGIETWISDFLNFSKGNYLLLGFGEKNHYRISAGYPRTRSGAISRVIKDSRPDGYHLLLGVLKNRRLISRRVFLHRIELVIPLKILVPKARIVLFVHTNLRAQAKFDSGKRWQLKGPIYKVYERFALKVANLVVVHSRIDFDRISRLSRKALLADAWFNDRVFSGGSKRKSRSGILWVGRFERVKDPLLAIRAFARSASLHSEDLEMVGDGPLKGEAQLLIEKLGLQQRARILPVQSQQQLASTLTRSKLLLHTSYFEGAPRILVEAAAQGVNLVTCKESDPESLGRMEGLGVQAANRSENAFAEAIGQALAKTTVCNRHDLAERAGSHYVGRLERKILEALR